MDFVVDCVDDVDCVLVEYLWFVYGYIVVYFGIDWVD